jgi:hypothetical protein
MSLKDRHKKALWKKARRGLRGYPVATVAFYGPDDRRASKVSVGVIPAEGAEIIAMDRWFSDDRDVRNDPEILEKVLAFIRENGAKSVAMTDRIIGCPHEEGTDYEGEICPKCLFWTNRDRWTGERIT